MSYREIDVVRYKIYEDFLKDLKVKRVLEQNKKLKKREMNEDKR